MAALLDRFHLNRHSLPDAVVIDLARELDRRAARNMTCRPRLVATWHLGADGRAVCAWVVDEASGGRSILGRRSG
jgi:hypothetical protein